MRPRRRTASASAPRAVSPRPFIGMGLMASSFFLYAASVLVAPWWGVVLLLVVWAGLMRLSVRWWTPHPDRLPWVGAGSLVFWFVAVLAGGLLLGWGP